MSFCCFSSCHASGSTVWANWNKPTPPRDFFLRTRDSTTGTNQYHLTMIAETDGLCSKPTQSIEWLFITLSFDPKNGVGVSHGGRSINFHVQVVLKSESVRDRHCDPFLCLWVFDLPLSNSESPPKGPRLPNPSVAKVRSHLGG